MKFEGSTWSYYFCLRHYSMLFIRFCLFQTRKHMINYSSIILSWEKFGDNRSPNDFEIIFILGLIGVSVTANYFLGSGKYLWSTKQQNTRRQSSVVLLFHIWFITVNIFYCIFPCTGKSDFCLLHIFCFVLRQTHVIDQREDMIRKGKKGQRIYISSCWIKPM